MEQQESQASGAETEEKSGGWGCLKIIMGLFAFGLLAMIALAYYAFNTTTGQQVFQAARDGYSIFKDAQSAPGTDALRAAGCKEAASFDLERVRTLVERFDDNASTDIDTDIPVNTIVTCGVETREKPPKCDALALVYKAAASPKGDFGLVVNHRKTVKVNEEKDVLCDGLYDAQGKRKSSLQEAKDSAPEQ